MKLALISDTHGLLRPEVLALIEGVDRIVHAGDIGPAEVLVELETVAPVTAVWGNTDGFDVRGRVPETARERWEGCVVAAMHGHQIGMPTPESVAAEHPDADLVVFGHTHRPVIRQVGSVLAVNPGSCGPRRFDLWPSLVLARLREGEIDTELVEFEV